MKIVDFLEKDYGYDKRINDNWAKYIDLWRSWYVGHVKSFHKYSIYNGRKTIKKEKLSMQMAKKCCEDWADTLFNERVKIELENESDNERLFEIFENVNFWEFINSAVERSGSVGTGAIVVSMSNIEVQDGDAEINFTNAETNLDYVDLENIYPLTWNNNRVTECAFSVKKYIMGNPYVFLTIHVKNESGNYRIINKVYKANKNDDNLIEVGEDGLVEMGVVQTYETNQPYPLFAILRPAGTNNINPNVPYGLPYYAQAIDVLKRIDDTFDSLQNEISLGKKRIFVQTDMVYMDKSTGEEIKTFDPNDLSVYILPKGFNSNDLIQSENSDLRIESLTKDLENSLALFGDKVGFGVQYYQLDPTGQVREIGILTQNSKMIRRKKKHEIVLESALFDIVTAIMSLNDFRTNDGLKITFDNDIIDDENERKKTALSEVSAGVKSKAEYRVEFFGETEEVAESVIEKINEENTFTFTDEPLPQGD